MIYREILSSMNKWASSDNRKPLVLRGARQVGKTTVVEMFSSYFENYIYLNLENTKEKEIFQNNLDISELIDLIILNSGIRIKPGKILIFIDEIQNCPEAVSSLRYFYEKKPNLHVVAAGSLLEIMMSQNKISFPVGRVEYRYIYPLNFQEFLNAVAPKKLVEMYNCTPVKEHVITVLQDYFHTYSMIGGMPEIVSRYLETNQVSSLQITYESLMRAYIDDVKKYADSPNSAEVIRHVIESAPFESGKRIKYQGFGNSNYKSREVSEAMNSLQRAMLSSLVFPTTQTVPPFRQDKKKSPRLQFVDTGLANYATGLQPHFFKHSDLQSIDKGRIVEHIVGQELISQNFISPSTYNFWVREKKQSSAEVDFLQQYEDKLIPIEVKSGSVGTLRSLHKFMDDAPHAYAVRLYAGKVTIDSIETNSGKKYKLLNLPYCFAGKLQQYLKWFIENY